MENRTNILTVAVEPNRTNTTEPLYQFDYGQKLVLEGVELPEAYEVHFGNSESGNSTTSIGGSDGVDIPNVYLTTGKDVYAWLYLHTGEDDGETVIRIRIPVRKRAKITNAEPTPVQQDAITQAIAALNAGVDRADAESLESEGYAVGTQNGVPVQEGSPYYENNSKYYAEQAGSGAEAIIDDTAGAGVTKKTWSADKLVGQFNTKAPVDSPAFTGRISMGRKAGSTSGTRSVATGSEVVASGQYSHAEGYQTTASGVNSHAEGGSSVASGNQSHAEGSGTVANLEGAHAEGLGSKALGTGSHAEGVTTVANANYSHSEGASTEANGYYSHAEGQGTKATNSSSHAEGNSTNATGAGAHAEGNGTTASAAGSHSEGNSTTASAEAAHSEGAGTTASGTNSHAEGGTTAASGQNSHAEGASTNAIGNQSHAEGVGGSNKSYYYYVYTNGQTVQRSVEKVKTGAEGSSSHSEGNMTTAAGYGSHAEGVGTIAHSDYAHAEGYETYAGGSCAHAEGNRTTALAVYSHAEGDRTIAQGNYTHAEGCDTIAVNPGAHAEGVGTKALDDASHAEGNLTTASGNYAHAEGGSSVASGDSSHAEGGHTEASGFGAHAEGYYTNAKGFASHTEGNLTNANGVHTHAEGYETSADGDNSHAEGHGTVAKGNASHVSGEYNVPDSYDTWDEWVAYTPYVVGDKVKRPKIVDNVVIWVGYVCITANSDASFTQSKWMLADNKLNYAVIVGNGSGDNNRSNAFALGWDGTGHFAGDVYVGCNPDGTGGTKLGAGGGDVIDDTAGPFDTNKTWSASKLWSDFAGKVNKTGAQFNDVSMNRVPNSTVGNQSVAIGTAQNAEQGAIASGANSVAVGAYVQATGNKAIAIGDNAQASGLNSTAIGGMVTASGDYSFAHGSSASAQGINSTAEGYGTTASGIGSHAEGSQTRAIGDYAHSQGYGGVANGYASNVEGNGTVANGANSSVSGLYNVPDSYENWPDWAPNTYYAAGAKVHLQVEGSGDPRGEYFVCNTSHTSGTAWITYSFYWDSDNGKMNYAQIVGNGSNYLQQSNAFSLGWDGTGHFAGDVYVNCNPDGSGGVKLEPVVFATDAHTQEIFATV